VAKAGGGMRGPGGERWRKREAMKVRNQKPGEERKKKTQCMTLALTLKRAAEANAIV